MFLNLLIEVILFAILVGGSCFGYRRGLFRMVAEPIKKMIPLLLAFSLCNAIGKAIIAPVIRKPIGSFLTDFLNDGLANTDFTKIPTVLRMMGGFLGISSDGNVTDANIDTVTNLFTEPFVTLISRAVAFILLFISLKYLLRLLVSFSDSFLSIGIIGTLNRVLGVLASACFAVTCATAFTVAIDYFFRTDIFAGSRLVSDFDGGPLYNLFNNLNPLTLLLSF